MLLGQTDDHTGQADQRDQVGDGHKAVERIGDVPDQVHFQGGADNNNNNENNLIDASGLGTQKEFTATGTVQRPAEDCGKSKQANSHSHDQRTGLCTENGGEGCDNQLRTCTLPPGDVHTALVISS